MCGEKEEKRYGGKSRREFTRLMTWRSSVRVRPPHREIMRSYRSERRVVILVLLLSNWLVIDGIGNGLGCSLRSCRVCG